MNFILLNRTSPIFLMRPRFPYSISPRRPDILGLTRATVVSEYRSTHPVATKKKKESLQWVHKKQPPFRLLTFFHHFETIMADSSPNADTVRIRIFRSRIFNVMQLIRYWPNPSNANFLNPLRVWGCRHYTRLTLKFVCILAPLCLLVFPLLPNITQFETHFYNVHNLTIINHGFATPNVTKIGVSFAAFSQTTTNFSHV